MSVLNGGIIFAHPFEINSLESGAKNSCVKTNKGNLSAQPPLSFKSGYLDRLENNWYLQWPLCLESAHRLTPTSLLEGENKRYIWLLWPKKHPEAAVRVLFYSIAVTISWPCRHSTFTFFEAVKPAAASQFPLMVSFGTFLKFRWYLPSGR